MRSLAEIRELLDELERQPAADLEDQDLDFKEWNSHSMADAVALCMANGRGGTVVCGVHDERVGRRDAIPGLPPEVDVNRLKKAIHDSTVEAGEHWTPRDAVKLMARLIFLPVADQLDSGTYLLYDGACGSGRTYR